MNRRLVRSADDRVIAGVAGGMAETYDMDPALVRVLWALLIVFTGGVFLIIYIVMALVVPLRGYEPAYFAGRTEFGPGDETTAAGTPAGAPAGAEGASGGQPGGPPPAAGQPGGEQPYNAWRRERRGRNDNTGPLILGALLIIVGGLFLARQFINIDIGQLWPIAVIALGVLLIVSAFGRRGARE